MHGILTEAGEGTFGCCVDFVLILSFCGLHCVCRRTASQVALSDGKSSSLQASASSVPVVGVLLSPLKELLETATRQQEVMRELVAAVTDADRGKQGALNAFLQQRQQVRPGREDAERLRAEVNELREENGKLRERLRVLEGGAEVRRRTSPEGAS